MINFYTMPGDPAVVEWFENRSIDLTIYETVSGSVASDIIIPEDITAIGQEAYKGNTEIETVVIPENVTYISDSAFEGCTGLRTVVLPEGLVYIGRSAFSGCSSLESIVIPEGVMSVESNTFSNCSALTSVTIPSSASYIGQNAFSGCGMLTEVTVPEGVATLGDYAFYNCSSLTTVSLPSTLTGIGSSAFYYCRALSSVNIPSGVTSIGSEAFRSCESLTSVYLPAGLTSAGTDVFAECFSLTDVTVGCSTAGEGMFLYCDNVKNVIVEEGVNYLGNSMFEGCSPSLVAQLPTTLTGMGTAVFPSTSVLVCPAESQSINLAQHFGYRYVVSGSALDVQAETDTDENGKSCAEFSLVTDAGADSVSMYSESGAMETSFKAEGNSEVRGSVRVWNLSYSFDHDGSRTMTFRSFDASGMQMASANCSLELLGYNVLSAEFNPASISKGTSADITVVTNLGAEYLHMYAENGDSAASWPAEGNSVVEDGTRVWSVQHTFSTAGQRSITFKASDNKETAIGAGINAGITVNAEIAIISVQFNESTVYTNRRVGITAVTPVDAAYLHMYSESDQIIESWESDKNSTVEDDRRIWNVSYSFANPGVRSMLFRASQGSEASGGSMKASVTVSADAPSVGYVAFESETASRGEPVIITAKTNANARELVMLDKDGQKITSWNASERSVISGSERLWTVTYPFVGLGEKDMTFKATADGSTFGYASNAKITIVVDYAIESAEFIESTAYRDETVNIHVVTGADANILYMYNSDGKLAREWPAEGNSVTQNGRRIWDLTLAFKSSGVRNMTFKAAMDDKSVSDGVADTIVIPAETPAIGFVSFNMTEAAVGEEVVITVKTNADATSVAMHLSDGTFIKAWPAEDNSVVSGTERIWTLKYSFSGAGERRMVFKATRDGETYGYSQAATITIK